MDGKNRDFKSYLSARSLLMMNQNCMYYVIEIAVPFSLFLFLKVNKAGIQKRLCGCIVCTMYDKH